MLLQKATHLISATNNKDDSMPSACTHRLRQRRRSPRLMALEALSVPPSEQSDDKDTDESSASKCRLRNNKRGNSNVEVSILDPAKTITKRRRRNASSQEMTTSPQCTTSSNPETTDSTSSSSAIETKTFPMTKRIVTLPRTLEESIRSKNPHVQFVLGIDEAGRGPLAGPVVVAAVQMMASNPTTTTNMMVEGVVDSKKITSEVHREVLYEQLMLSLLNNNRIPPDSDTGRTAPIMWAIAVIDAATIDAINILQATLLGMRLVAAAIVGQSIEYPIMDGTVANVGTSPLAGCYVIVSKAGNVQEQPSDSDFGKEHHTASQDESKTMVSSNLSPSTYYALIDGNRLPKDMPCPADAIVKGDSREYCIAAASILAKVTRDRIMHRYNEQYPQYNFSQHKGYPTVQHVTALKNHGPSPIHRLSFAPLKNSTIKSKK
jgi:ribonuclease HII